MSSFTPTDELRIQKIENTLNQVQTALNGVATVRQLNLLFGLFTQQVADLQASINQTNDLSAHLVDPYAHSGLYWYYGKSDHVNSFEGPTVAGQPIALNMSGYLDWSLLSGVANSGVI
jgi:hypothetical protein